MTEVFKDKSKILQNSNGHAHEMLFDEENCDLYDQVHPMKRDEFINPAQEGEYDILIIGAGAGGLVTAA